MQIGQEQYPIEESVLFLILILVLGFNVFLFNRGHGSYTIKYEIMRKRRFFRENQFATTIVNTLYQFFFILPFIIIAAITVLRGTKNQMEFPAIFVNGLLVILMVYPVYREYYYFQYGVIWFLALASQAFSQFLADANTESTSSFMEISFIFYTLNSLVFCLALLFNEKVYWELQEGLSLVDKQQVKNVNASWLDQTKERKLPQIFYGGIYGAMSKNPSFTYFLGIYLFSLAILLAYGIVIYFVENSMLGFCGLVTNFIYDVFILVFSSLRGTQRSIKDLFLIVFLGRLLSFVFGQQYWLFGYCILYFFVGIFVGNVIIDKNFPMRIDSNKKATKRIKKNVLKTPEFILFLLTVEIIVLLVVEEVSSIADVNQLQFHGRPVPIWQFAILIIIAAWVIILYLLCGRLLSRQIMRIREMVEYYFGTTRISQYHAYMFLTFALILAGGFYSLFYLYDRDIFLACVFLPAVYHFIFEIGSSWVKNDYCILAEFQAYDKKELQKLRIRIIKLKNRKLKVEKTLAKRKEKNLEQQTSGSAIDQKNQDDPEATNTAFQFTISNPKNINGKKLAPINNSSYKSPKNQRKSFVSKLEQSDEKKLKDTEVTPESGSIKMNNNSAQLNEIQKQINELQQRIKAYPQLRNWRQDTDLSFIQIWQNLTPHDKTILVSLLLTLISLAGYSVVSFLWAETIGGLAFAISIISMLTAFFYYKIVMSLRHSAGQVILTVVGFLMGVVFWAIFYKTAFGGIAWSFLALILYAYCLKSSIEKLVDEEYTYLKVILSIKIVLLLCFICILLGLNYGDIILVVSFAIVVAMMFGALSVYHLFTHGHIPKLLKIITGIILIAIMAVLQIVGFVLDIISDFTVFAFGSGILIVGLLIVYGIISFTNSRNQLISPHVYSAFGLTIYRFQSDVELLKSSTNHIQIFNGAMILLVIFSSITTLFFTQKYVAIYALSVFMLCQFTQLIFRSIETHYFFGQYKENITKKIVNQAFKTVKDKYMAAEIQGEDSPQFIQRFQKAKDQAEKATDAESRNTLWKTASQLKQELLQNLQEEQRFLFFWMALIRFSVYTERRNKMNDFLIFLEQNKLALQEIGIFFESLQSTDPVQIKYKMAKKQLNLLPPDDYLIVMEKLEDDAMQRKKRQKQIEKSHKEEKEAHQKKMQELFKKEALMNEALEKQEKLGSKQNQKVKSDKKLTQKQPAKQKPAEPSRKDEIKLFKQMLQGLGKNVWQDKDFDLNDQQKTLGNLKNVVKSVRRPKPEEKFINNSISADDVKQGKIGDCYLISSFAVLGEKYLKQALGFNQKDEQSPYWVNEKGAFMVKLHMFSRQSYIKVDDTLPVDDRGEKVFAVSQDSKEYWPGILEKAYAKIYGGYHKIVSGKCHQVLAEFSGGFPFEIKLQEYKKNNNALWNKLITAKQNGYLMAAGSPSNQRGDSAVSKSGIVQGHAYSILDVKEIQNQYKLIQLKNPHGTGGKEWSGEFSDKSNYMNPTRRKLLGHSDKNDGIFWMQLKDFIKQFFSLYICCIFDPKDHWKKFDPISATWTEQNSFGRSDKAETPHKNYQIGITVTKQCTLFISLRQTNLTALEGENFVLMRVQRNEGKRLSKNDTKSANVCGLAATLSNAATISQQVLMSSDEYPYTFTIYVCAEQPSKEGKIIPGMGKFNIEIFCNDQNAKLLKHEQFDTDESAE